MEEGRNTGVVGRTYGGEDCGDIDEINVLPPSPYSYIMTLDEIKKLIAQGETRTLELKKSTGELKDGMHSACAFLNTDGGWLLFGIAPKSLKIVGQ